METITVKFKLKKNERFGVVCGEKSVESAHWYIETAEAECKRQQKLWGKKRKFKVVILKN